jgi:putative SOS response-associated peptidase YedK
MCGRAYLKIDYSEWHRRFRAYFGEGKLEPVPQDSLDFRPTQTTTVILGAQAAQAAHAPRGRSHDHETAKPPAALCMPWGWHIRVADHEKLLINARSETIAQKPMFKRAFETHRCVMPVSGFIEWKREPKKKTPHRIGLERGGILSLAGLWRPEGFIVLTLGANPQVSAIHDRMPVMLTEEQEAVWLSETQDLAKLRRECLVPRLSSFHIEPTELPKPFSTDGRKAKPASGQMQLL